MTKYLWFFSVLLLASCATSQTAPTPEHFTSSSCQKSYEKSTQKKDGEKQLDMVSALFDNSCFQEAIVLGSFLRQKSHDKFYDVGAEMAEIVTPEGTFTEYVMESYERTYLSLLISMSYLNLQQTDDALVELRRSQQEAQAFIYNYGEDPVLILLQAALWDRFDPLVARPYWKSLKEDNHQDLQIRNFAESRLKEIDTHPTDKVLWRIDGIGILPELEWSSHLFKGDLYKIQARSEFPHVCVSGKSLLVPTISWTDKIAAKYKASYHPFLLAKSLVRLPVGIGYGIVGVSTGVVVGVGGCAMTAKAGSDNLLCESSLRAGGYLIDKSTDLAAYTLKPDLRHWESVPKAFYLNAESPDHETSLCLKEVSFDPVETVHLVK